MKLQNLMDVLTLRAAESPDKRAYSFLGDGETPTETLTYAELDEQARAIGATLQHLCRPGDRAVLLYEPGLAFVAAFLGCQYAGVVAVPTLPPNMNRIQTTVDRLYGILRDAEPSLILTTGELLPALKKAMQGRADLSKARWQATDRLDRSRARFWTRPDCREEGLSFLQYTSGSTQAPRGVMVTHWNILENLAMLRQVSGLSPSRTMVGWLPLFHDMGLIGIMLHGLFAGGETHLMSPLSFLKKPVRWLRAISGRSGVFSGGPNFAFDLCVERITEEQKQGLDLTGWEVAFSGAETVRAATLDRFYSAFKGHGLRRESLLPCYGLAEATLVVSARTPGSDYRALTVDRAALEKGSALPREPGAGETLDIVSCGEVKGEQQLAIVDPETRQRRDDGEIGEIWVKGAHVAAGYWRSPEQSRETFSAMTADGDGPFLRTGDLGFVCSGELHVTGRIKEILLVRGRCLYPQDIEAAVGALSDSFPEVRADDCVAFSLPGEDAERIGLIVQVNTQKNPRFDAGQLIEAVQERLLREMEIGLDEVVLVKSAVPRTSSGKKMRTTCRQLLKEGLEEKLKVVHRHRRANPALAADPARAAGSAHRPFTDERALAIFGRMAAWIARRERLDPERIAPGHALTDLGLDSLAAVSLVELLEGELDLVIGVGELEKHRTLGDLASHLATRVSRDWHPRSDRA
ncbi:MAG: AMP-binding protein [Polyangiaceae bacterium]